MTHFLGEAWWSSSLLPRRRLQTQGGGEEEHPSPLCQDKEKDRLLRKTPESQIRGSATLIPQPDALIILINKECATLFLVQNNFSSCLLSLLISPVVVFEILNEEYKVLFMQTMFYFTGRFKLRKDREGQKPSVGQICLASCQMDHDLLGILLSILCQCNAETVLLFPKSGKCETNNI